MNDYILETTGLYPHELRGQTVIDTLSEFVEHLVENRAEVPDGTTITLRDASGKFEANYRVTDNGHLRAVTLIKQTDLH